MLYFRALAPTLLLSLSLAACSDGSDDETDRGANVASIDSAVTARVDVVRRRIAANNAKDWDTWESLHAVDAVRTAPELPEPLRGAKAMLSPGARSLRSRRRRRRVLPRLSSRQTGPKDGPDRRSDHAGVLRPDGLRVRRLAGRSAPRGGGTPGADLGSAHDARRALRRRAGSRVPGRRGPLPPVQDHDGWQFATGCEGAVVGADGAPVFRGVLQAIAVNPSEGIGGLAIAAPDSTEGKVTCPGSQMQCGPGSKFHAACDGQHGGFEGSNPDSHGIPQTWSCNVP